MIRSSRPNGTTLVEASPEDRIWGIGLAAGQPGCGDRRSWLGGNWLGEVLTDVRERLKLQGNVASKPSSLLHKSDVLALSENIAFLEDDDR